MARQNAEKSRLTEGHNNNVSVYRETTTTEEMPKKRKRRDKSDLGPDFVPPDGGWGWVVCFAAGLSNLFMFPALQQYGLIYRERMESLGFDAKQTTTIANVGMAISSLMGILNGAIFRRFTFRQVALTGTLLSFFGILSSAFATTFLEYLLLFACVYSIGLGLAMTATSLAVNTYFKLRRRRATGFAWTITGLGPIIFPHITTWLLVYYGAQGTILVYAALVLNAVLCAFTLQPVLWHVRRQPTKVNANNDDDNDNDDDDDEENNVVAPADSELCIYCQFGPREKRGIFSSQYLFNNDDPDRPGYEICEPGTPMLARANDGWYGSKLSLASATEQNMRTRHKRQQSITTNNVELKDDNGNACNGNLQQLSKPNYFVREREDFERYASKTSIHSRGAFGISNGSGHGPVAGSASVAANQLRSMCTCRKQRYLLPRSVDDAAAAEAVAAAVAAEEADELAKSQMTFRQKIVKFFDLDLLRDFTFVNLVLGMTIMMFGEMNFSVLTPFILNSYGYTNKQISLAMSLLGGMDIIVRFLAPFALENVKWNNRVLFAFGIIAISIGRLITTLTDSYNVTLAVFLLIGFGKGFRTIFSPLIIPSYVPLHRLPAATGLQLLCNTLFSFAFGPLLGYITDRFNYTMTIHAINALTCTALLLWLSESTVRRLLGKSRPAQPME